MKKVNINTIKGIKSVSSFVVPVGTELNTGITSFGLFEVILSVHGSSALIHISLTADSSLPNVVVSDPRSMVSVQADQVGRLCFFRKETYGPIFVKNNSALNQTFDMMFKKNRG